MNVKCLQQCLLQPGTAVVTVNTSLAFGGLGPPLLDGFPPPLENKEVPHCSSSVGPGPQPWTGAASARRGSEYGLRTGGCWSVRRSVQRLRVGIYKLL